MRDKFEELGIKLNSNAIEQKTLCPKCSSTRRNKKDPCLSLNLQKGVYNCHNCGWSGNVKFEAKTNYVEPVLQEGVLSLNTVKWFAKRGITQSTLNDWRITESKEYFPQIQKERTAINFNYFLDRDLVNVKYRDGEKNFKLVKDAKLIFYGLNNVIESDRCIIVEGEIDALSLYEAGIKDVCSVPNGASKGSQKLAYLDNCYKYFENKKEIILFTDSDDAGLSLRNELARRFGNHRCKYIELSTYKDANEVLVNAGAGELRKLVEGATSFPIDGVLQIDDIWNSVLNYTENGIKNYTLGFRSSDEWFKLCFGEWTCVTGVPNSGKSDFIDMVCVNLAVIHDFRVAMYAPESYPFEGHIKRIANKVNEKNCTVDDLNNSKDFIKEHFYFVKIDLENLSLKNILNKFRELVFQKGVNVLVIDPWNMLDHKGNADHFYIGTALSLITQFCQQTNTHLFLIAHPRKMDIENGKYRVPTPYDISGSSDFFNKAYNCITVHRELGMRSTYKSDVVSIHTQKVKRKENGAQGKFRVAPDFMNGGVYRDLETHEAPF